MSQPARAVWIEIQYPSQASSFLPSQPARAVWIEILLLHELSNSYGSQPARAVWIEIPIPDGRVYPSCSHSLRGLCGLKFPEQDKPGRQGRKSQPARAVWIEITMQPIVC